MPMPGPHTSVAAPLRIDSQPGRAIRVAILDPFHSAPAVFRELFGGRPGMRCELVSADEPTVDASIGAYDVVLLADGTAGSADHSPDLVKRLLERVQRQGLGAAVLTDRAEGFAAGDSVRLCLPLDCPAERLCGALAGLAAWRPAARAYEDERSQVRRVNESVHTYFEAMDHELRLASRLQKDFMPRGAQQIGPACFTTVYRPCSWVSGDIFDILRLDESHVGFYLADAVGHGVAAGLLTMYIKHAIQPKRVHAGACELVAPAEVLSRLNDQLTAQELPDAQFITGWYGLLNTQTLRLDYSVAGHPPAMWVEASGVLRELHGEGLPLGLWREEQFAARSVTLKPGDRLLLYSDGLEGVLIARRPSLPQMPHLVEGVADLMRSPGDRLLAGLTEALDNAPGSLNRADDVSIVLLDIDRDYLPTRS
jgi:serine phosphatase RsbU (regulator of sigma subunit)